MAELTRDTVQAILDGAGITRHEVEQLCRRYLATPPAGAGEAVVKPVAHVVVSEHGVSVTGQPEVLRYLGNGAPLFARVPAPRSDYVRPEAGSLSAAAIVAGMIAAHKCRELNGERTQTSLADLELLAAHLQHAAPTPLPDAVRELVGAAKDASELLDEWTVQIEDEWGACRGLGEIERDGDVEPRVVRLRAALRALRDAPVAKLHGWCLYAVGSGSAAALDAINGQRVALVPLDTTAGVG